MATEEKIILSADVTKAAESVAELKEQIKTLRDTIQDEATSVEESAAAAELLKVKQQALRGIMAGSAEAFKNAQDTSEGMTKSYNTLVTEMAKLKAEWRASTDTMERVELGKKINEINDQLKNLDASTGNFQRNVGDYANQMSKAFQMTAGSAGSVINPLNNVKGAMMAVSSTPLIAILGLLANIIMTVIQNLKKSEQGMNALSEAFAAFQVVGDLVTKVLEGIGWALTKVIGWIGEMTAAIIGNNEAMAEKIRLHELERQALETERENIKLNAEAERDISDLRAKAADKINYSAQERIEMLKKAGDLEAEISKRNLELARQEYEAWQLRNKPTESSEEDLKAEAEAYAKMLQAETAYNNKQREMTAQITEARKQIQSEAKQAIKERTAQVQASITAERDLMKQEVELLKQNSIERYELEKQVLEKEHELKVNKAKSTITDTEQLNRTLLVLEKQYQNSIHNLDKKYNESREEEEIQTMRNRQETHRKGSYEYLADEIEIRQKLLEQVKQMEDESDVQFEARRLKAESELKQSQMALVEQQITEQREALELQVMQAEGDAFTQLQAKAELARYNWETTYQGMNESYEHYLQRKLTAEEEYKQAQMEAESFDQTKVDMEAQLEQMQADSMQRLEAEVMLKKYELDTIHQLEWESDADFKKRMLQAEKEYNDAKKKLSQSRLNITMASVNAVAGLMSSLAAVYESDTDASEEELRKAKNLKIAGAIMSTIEGAIGAFMNASKAYDPPFGQIIGAISAATVTAAGIAQVRQLQSQEVNKNASGATTMSPNSIPLPSSEGATATAPTMEPVIESVRTITTASEEEQMNQSQKVYLVTDELEMMQKSKRVRMAETTF